MEVHVHESPGAVARAASDRIGALVSDGDSRLSLGLAGGSTPKATYRALCEWDKGWDRVDAWLSDERWVPHDDALSNGRMATETLLNHVNATFHRPEWGEDMAPADSASRYETQLREIHGDRRPDVIILGLGADGHTASLFPETDAIDESKRWFVSNDVPRLSQHRLTATYPLLHSARLIMVLTVGLDKALAVKASFEGHTPAGRLGDGEAVVEWHTDHEAASLLK